jgi:Ni,Fe-hydrogenase III component G
MSDSIKDTIRERLEGKVVSWEEKSPRRMYIVIKKEDIFETVKILFKELGLRFCIASGLEVAEGFEILYHFTYDATGEVYTLRVFINDRQNPTIDAITPLFPGAEWIEREMWELLGINFKNHPNLKRLLLSDDWPEGNYPLRKRNEP